MDCVSANEMFFMDNKHKVKRQHTSLLMYLYDWISSPNPPISRTIGGKIYFLVNYNHLSKMLKTGYMNIRNRMKRLCGDETSDLAFFSKVLAKGKKGHTVAWLSLNQHLARRALSKDCKAYKNLFPRKEDMEEGLFEIDETKINYPDEAIGIVKLALSKYQCYFKDRVPTMNSSPTKSYLSALRKVTDIYNGSFTNPHLYSLSEKFNNNKQFESLNWRSKVKEAKGDWSKVRSMVLMALRNFDKMHLPMYLPFSKDYLQTNFSLWLFDNWEGQSQFIQCLEEPWEIKTLLSEEKADRIFKRLPENARKAGNRFYDMNNSIGPVALWQGVERIMLWAKEVFKHDKGAKYWASSYMDIPLKFQEFCKERDIQVSSSTMDMQKALITDAPWRWFLSDAIRRHGMDKRLLKTYTPEQVKGIYGDSNDFDIPF